MKTAVIALIFLTVLFILWRLNSAKTPPLLFSGNALHIHEGTCTIDLPSYKRESESVDVLDITRYFLKTPSDAELIYESVDFPATYDFAYPTDAVVAKIFGFSRYSAKSVNRHITFVNGTDPNGEEFVVLAAAELNHRIQLLYPLDKEMAARLEECLVKGRKSPLSESSGSTERSIRPDWSESEIIKENLIEKHM
ncbi:hypothetical protein NNO_0713 [Hydrogenimonas sp.]|nr:hypothetical protein NNO_0713 [Hydrogenimonas sp.]